MATATITIDGDKRNIDGGSSSDYLVLNDVMSANNSDLTGINYNAVRMTNRQAKQYIFKDTSYVDFTDARLFLTNDANNQIINTEFEGNIRVGSDLDPIGFCEIHWGDKDNGGYDTSRFPLFGTTDNAVISCPNIDNRIKLMSHLDGPNSSLAKEPGAKNGVTIQNNNAESIIRVSLLGASHTYGQGYVLPDANGFKPNGTVMCMWKVGADVPVRDIEFRDGYVDWRPEDNWATPTRGVFVSETWMKFLGSSAFTYTEPLIFGNQDDPFQVIVGNSGQTGSYILHGIYSTGSSGRIVYNNYMGLSWATQMALYSAGDEIQVENHLQLDYKLIDSFAQPIDGAVITTYKKDPVYNSANDVVGYSGAENSFDTTTDADGQGNIGNADGSNSNNVCVEAFCRRDTGGNVDTHYANKDHSTASYDNNKDIYYTVIKWGKKPIIRMPYICKLSGETGEGKQSLGVIQLETALSLVSPTINDVPATITDAESFYDVAYKYSVDNKIALFCERESDTIVTAYDIIVDGNATNLIDFDGTTIIAKISEWNSSITSPNVSFKTALDLATMKLDTDLHYVGSVTTTIDYTTHDVEVLHGGTSLDAYSQADGMVNCRFNTATDITTGQIIWESGGGGVGIALAIQDGVFKVYAGNDTTEYCNTFAVTADTKYHATVLIDLTNSKINLFVTEGTDLAPTEDDLVSSSDFTKTDWCGGNETGVGGTAGTTRAPFSTSFTGTVDDGKIYFWDGGDVSTSYTITHSGANGTDVDITFDSVIVTGDVLNDMPDNIVTIKLINGSTATTSEPGTGNGEVNIINTKVIKMTDLPNGIEVRIKQGSFTLHHNQNVVGNEEEYSYNYIEDIKVNISFVGAGIIQSKTIRNFVLRNENQTLPVLFDKDPSYIS